jgi:hypothetical protein
LEELIASIFRAKGYARLSPSKTQIVAHCLFGLFLVPENEHAMFLKVVYQSAWWHATEDETPYLTDLISIL